MQLLLSNYKIASYSGGYKVSKRKGKQWAVVSYHDSLDEAVKELFDLRVKVDTKDFIVDYNDSKNFKSQKDALVNRIKEIKNETLMGVWGNKR